MPRQITETVHLTEAAVSEATRTGRMLMEFITPGWGSSGYYSPAVLEQAATDNVIPAGTHMYADHPTATEEKERPERSIKDLMAVTTEAAHLSESGSLVGTVQVVPSWQPFLGTVHAAIGASIRGSATDIVPGVAEGREGGIIEGLIAPVTSVDFVTRAGRGGKVLQLLESARRAATATTRAIGHGVAEATVNDIRDALSNTCKDAHGGDKTYVWVRDFDDTTVWFEIENEAGGNNGIFAQTYTSDGAALTGDKTEVRVVTTYQPVGEADTTTSRSTRPGSTTHNRGVQEDTMPNIEESEIARLREDAGRVPALTTERDTAVSERDEARTQLAETRAHTTAIAHARARVVAAKPGFPAATVDRIVAESTRTIPLTDTGTLDTGALDTAVDTARTAEEAYVAALAEASGVGTVSGFGGTTVEPVTVSESDIDAAVGSAFGRQPVKGA